jgi:hypothetical protein
MAHGIARLILDQRLDAHVDGHIDTETLVRRAGKVFVAGLQSAHAAKRR